MTRKEDLLMSVENVHTEFKGDKLIITVDISDKTVKSSPMSKSGKNKLVATTGGFVGLEKGFAIGLNVTRKP